MQIWNMKMKMGVIKVIYEAPQSHLWRRHESLVSFMCERLSFFWQASLPQPGRGHSAAGTRENCAARDCCVLYQHRNCVGTQKRKACTLSVTIQPNTRKEMATSNSIFKFHAWFEFILKLRQETSKDRLLTKAKFILYVLFICLFYETLYRQLFLYFCSFK